MMSLRIDNKLYMHIGVNTRSGVNRALLYELLDRTSGKELVNLVGSSFADASKFGLAFP